MSQYYVSSSIEQDNEGRVHGQNLEEEWKNIAELGLGLLKLFSNRVVGKAAQYTAVGKKPYDTLEIRADLFLIILAIVLLVSGLWNCFPTQCCSNGKLQFSRYCFPDLEPTRCIFKHTLC